MNMEIGTVDAQFFFWEYLFRIFGIGFMQCISITILKKSSFCWKLSPMYTEKIRHMYTTTYVWTVDSHYKEMILRTSGQKNGKREGGEVSNVGEPMKETTTLSFGQRI